MDPLELYKNRYEREKVARKEAEKLLEEKSLELYKANQELSILNESLEKIVRKRTQQLKKTNEELEKFTYISSHDLKTPLRSISHIAHWIEEDYDTESKEEVLKNIQLIKSRVLRMENLINGILEYTKIGKEKSVPAMVDVEQLANEICEYESSRNEYTYIVSHDLPMIYTYRIQLFNIFSNLISNGIKHNNKVEKKIFVKCKKLEDRLYEFSVEDNGTGISEMYHDKIFDIFQTLERKGDNETIGVGLSIVKKLIDDNGGSIRVESEKNKGAKFIFTWYESED